MFYDFFYVERDVYGCGLAVDTSFPHSMKAEREHESG